MAGVVEFLIKAQDGLTGPLAKITTSSGTAKNALAQLTESNKQLRSMVQGSSVSINDLKNRIEKLKETRDILPAGQERKIRSVNSEINKLNKELQKMQTMNGSKLKTWFKEAFDGLPELVKNPLIAAGAAGVAAFNEGMKQSKEKLDFKLLVGEKAGKQVYDGAKKLKRFFGDGATEGAKTLVNKGVAAEDVSPLLEGIGKVAAGDANKFSNLIGAFGQLSKEGKLTESTLSNMVDSGFKPLTLISEKYNLSATEMQKLLEEGRIDIGLVKEALQTATSEGGIFANTLKEIDASPTGLWNRLTTGVSELSGKIGGLFMPVITPVFELMNWGLDLAIKGFDGLQKLIEENSGVVATLASVVGGAGIAWAFYQTWVRAAWLWQMRDLAVTSILTTLKGAQATVIGGLTVAWKGLTAAMMANPIGAILTGVVAVIGGIVLLAEKFEWARKIVYGVWEVMKAVVGNISTFFSNLFDGGDRKYIGIDVAYKKGADEASAEFANKKHGLDAETEREKLLKQYLVSQTENKTTDTNTQNNINAVSGGGSKNIEIKIGKVTGVETIRVSGGDSQKIITNIEEVIEQVMVRVLASAAR